MLHLLSGCGRRARRHPSANHALTSVASHQLSSFSSVPPTVASASSDEPVRPSRASPVSAPSLGPGAVPDASVAVPVRRRYAFEFPSAEADPSAAAASYVAAARRRNSDRCVNKHYVAFVQQQQQRLQQQHRRSLAAPQRRTEHGSLLPSEQSELSEPSDALSLSSVLAQPTPRPLPTIYSSASHTALPSQELRTVPRRLYYSFVVLLCCCTALYLALESEVRPPAILSSSSGNQHGQYVFTAVRKPWKEWKETWRKPVSGATVERGAGRGQPSSASHYHSQCSSTATASPANKSQQLIGSSHCSVSVTQFEAVHHCR